MISQGPVVVSAGKTKYSPTLGDQVEADGGELRPRRHPGHVGERERPHRLVVRRALGVALEQARDLALAGGDDDEVVSRARSARGRRAAPRGARRCRRARSNSVQPARHLHPLVDRLRRAGRAATPSRSPCRSRPARERRRTMPSTGGHSSSQKSRPRSRSCCEGGVEHALARHHLAVASLLGGAVGDDGDVVARFGRGRCRPGGRPDRRRRSRNLRIVSSPSVSSRSSLGIAGTACSGPIAE